MPGKSCVWTVTEASDTFAIPLGDERTSRMLTRWIFMESLPLPNGTIANTEDMEPLVKGEFPIVDSNSDTKLAGYRLLQHYRREHDWTRAFTRLAKEISGSYSFVIVTHEGEVLAARDESGFRPLCLGWDEETRTNIVASESCALTALHAELVRDVQPGELIRFNQDGLTVTKFAESPHHHCAFEYTYFAHPSSKIEDHYVYEARRQL